MRLRRKAGGGGADMVMGDETPRLVAPGGHERPSQQSMDKFDGKIRLLDPSKVYHKIMADDIGKEDIVTSWGDINFKGLNSIEVGEHGIYSFTEHAFEQLCAKLNVPSAYMQRCPLIGKAGRQEQLEYWREQAEDREIMLRVKKLDKVDGDGNVGTVRALLSKSYEPIDNMRLWSWTNDALERANGDLGIIYANINKVSTHFRLCFANPIDIGTKEHPDPHYFGIHISDSEVGTRALTMDYMLYRLACTNGLIMQVEGDKLLHQKHIHVDHVSLGRTFHEAIEAAFDHRESLMDEVAASRSAVIKDPHMAIRRIVRHHRGTQEFTDAVLAAFDAEPPANGDPATKFHIIQAFTRAARTMPIDRRHHVETIAGAYLVDAA